MKIAIVGGGFTGLTAAYYLSKSGHKVTIFEKDSQLGGLAVGWQKPGWDWSLERAYHHWFTNDKAAYALMRDLGKTAEIIVKRPTTATLYRGKMYPLDSVISLLKFPGLTPSDRLRTGLMLAFFKLNPFWQPLEKITAARLILALGGRAGWKTIWEPLLRGKFGPYADQVAASWFWARIKKRTPALAYPIGGFQALINTLDAAIRRQNGKILLNYQLVSLDQLTQFDKIIFTIPTPIIAKIAPKLASELSPSLNIPHLHAQVLILETEQPILEKIYWLNVTDTSFPFLAVVAHTNYMDPIHYGGRHINYIGNYLPPDHPYLRLNKDQLLQKFLPYLKKLSRTKKFNLKTTDSHLFTAPFAQPVHKLNYSTRAPKPNTNYELPNANQPQRIYIANMDSVFPWDRGTNYAIELGQKAAKLINLG